MTVNLPSKILPRLGKIIRMLGSNHDGDVLAAARMLIRTLASEGKSIHDLAAAVEAGTKTVTITSARHEEFVWEAPPAEHGAPPSWNDLRDFQRRDWLTAFVRRLDMPDKEERDALWSFRQQVINRPDARPNRRQLELFTRLIERAWRVGLRV